MRAVQEPAQESSVINKRIGLLHWRKVAFTWHQVGLGAILLLSAFLNLFRLDQNGFTNEFYAAAVRSMLVNWHNFFFNSFDPGGFITIDKPPLAFWFQALSAGLFGFNGVTILLPSAFAGVASVGLFYLTVKRVFGPIAGLLSALALAVSPIFVVMSRHNNPEAILVLSLVIAAWALTHATEKGKLAWLLLAVGMVGVGFNVKMLEAFVVLPAFYLVYFLLAPASWAINALFSPTFSNATLPTAVPVGGAANTPGFGFANNRNPTGFMAVLQANWDGWLSSLLIGLVILVVLTVALRFFINRLKGLKPLEKISTLGTVTIVIVLGISMAQTALPPVAAASGSRTTIARLPSTGVIGNPDMMFSNNDKLIAYLNANRDGSAYLLATASSQNASPLIIKTGQPVMALGGFMGSDKVLTVQELEQQVKDNTVRFFLLDGGRGGFGGGGNQQLFSWVQQTCKAIDTQLWSNSAATSGNNQGQANQSGTNQGTQPGFGGNTRGNQSGANNGTGRGTLPGTGGTTRGGLPGFGNGTGVQPGNGTTGRGVQPGFGGNGSGNQAGGTNGTNRIPPQQAFGGGRGGFGGGAQGSLYDCRGV